MPGLDSPAPQLAQIITGRFAPLLADASPPASILDILTAVAQRGPADTTRRTIGQQLDQLLLALCGRRLADLDEATARATLATLTEARIARYLATLGHLAPGTVNIRIAILRAICRRLTRAGLLLADPTADLKMRKMPLTSQTAWLSPEQAQRLIAACAGDRLLDLRDRAIITTMIYSGLRVSETARMAVTDLATIGGHQVLHVIGKGGAPERVKLRPQVLAALAAWRERAAITEGYLWRPLNANSGHTTGPGPILASTIATRLARRAELAGLADVALSPHSLRHTFVTLALNSGAPLARVQHAARHRSPQTTMRYAHDLDSLEDNAVDYISL